MPRYYFDSRDGDGLIRDDVGIIFPGMETARHQAALALAELARDVLSGSERHELAIDIRDEGGEPLLRASLIFEVQPSR